MIEEKDINKKWDNFEKSRGTKSYNLSINITNTINKIKTLFKPKTKDNYEYRYEHTNFVCKEPVDRKQHYCPRCGGKLVYKLKC
jgi:rRNA maturation endonuclease Nob1